MKRHSLEFYHSLSLKGRFQGLPRTAPQVWKDVLDITSGLGIRPFRNPYGKGWAALCDFKAHVPPLLRNYARGCAPDMVAEWLGFESADALYEALACPGWDPAISEKEYYKNLAENYGGYDDS